MRKFRLSVILNGMHARRRVIGLIILTTLLTACGQAGKLYLPPQDQPVTLRSIQ